MILHFSFISLSYFVSKSLLKQNYFSKINIKEYYLVGANVLVVFSIYQLHFYMVWPFNFTNKFSNLCMEKC